MPSANHETTLARQWELLKLIPPGKPGKSTAQLHDELQRRGHEVSRRTVERDLPELSRIFPILSNEISKPYGWHWMPGARVDFPGIDLAEAVSLGLLENLLRQLVPPTFMQSLEGRFDEAREKLKALPQNRYAQWADLVRYIPPGLPLLKPGILPEVLRSVQDSLLRQRQLKVTYTGPGVTIAKELLIHPLALIQKGERSYLLATTFDYEGRVYYALHRINSAGVIEEPAKRPASFSLDAFLADGGGQFGDGKTITLKANLTDYLANILRETAISPDQNITTRGGKNTLTATVTDSWQLHFWILSQGPAITVLKPDALQKQIITALKSSLSHYEAITLGSNRRNPM